MRGSRGAPERPSARAVQGFGFQGGLACRNFPQVPLLIPFATLIRLDANLNLYG